MENINLEILSGMSNLLGDLRLIINSAKTRVASTANTELTMMYWHIGRRVNVEILGNERAEYGQKIVATLSRQLQKEYGSKGFEPRSIRRMMQFASKFTEEKIVSTLSTQLTWSHIIEILPLKDPLQREFYLTLSASEHWGVRRLRKEIDSMLYERTAIATKPDELIKQELTNLRNDNVMSPDLVFKSPYFLEFAGLKGMYSEKNLEDSLIAHLEQESPLGLLLCTEGSEEQIELLQLDKAGIKVAQYMTELPSRKLLVKQIQKSLEMAKELGKGKNMKELFGEG